MTNISALLDTSVFIAREQARPIRSELVPTGAGISVVSLAELRLAVITAGTVARRAARLATLELALRIEPVAVTEAVAIHWAMLRAACRGQSDTRVNDLWIAATALVLGVPVVTQDDGFTRLAALGGPMVIRV